MNDRKMSFHRTALATFGVLATGLVILGVRDVRHQRRRYAPVKQYVIANVPDAAQVITGKGRFVLEGAQLRTEKRAPNNDGVQPIAATAPTTADGKFELSAPGAGSHASLRFVGLAAKKAQIDDGAAVYRDVLPDVDLVAVDDHERLELAFVVDKLATTPELAFNVTVPAGGSLRHEPGTEALLVADRDGRARFRVSQPVAVDAKGVKRQGALEIKGDTVRLAMRWEGLTAPIVVDPAVTIPLWSVLADGRGPGARVYDATSLSREPHVAFDAARGKTILVRPVRSKQFEDTTFQFGDPSRGQHEGAVQRIAPTKRVNGAGLAADATTEGEWLRGYSLASETWEWNGTSWALRDTAALPGMIDPALAFDSKRARVVLYGGAHPGISCYSPVDSRSSTAPYFCKDSDFQDVTYEYDGTTWLAKAITGSPSPRVRAAMAYDESREITILFGGRELDTSNQDRRVDPFGPMFPENFTKDLLADTWIYDGATWKRVPTATPPPALESAQLIYDPARKVTVLVGGRSATQTDGKGDALGIWEFDGTDWTERLHAGDSKLPVSLRTRKGAAAFWNAARSRIAIFGGNVDKLDSCTLTDAEISSRLTATASDPVGREALAATGCIGGYVHDFWEWDGTQLTQTAGVVFGGSVDGTWVFRQASGGTAWKATGTAATTAAALPTTGTPLLPWRYDQRADHFAPRTKLERTHLKTTNTATTPTVQGATPSAATPSSPLFASRARPDVAFDVATGTLQVFPSDSGAVYRSDGASWDGGVPQTSPFADGPNDFFAATWDSGAQKLVFFDPRTASTWTHADGIGWQRVAIAGASPPKWTVKSSVRVKADADLPRPSMYPDDGSTLVAIMKQTPRMTYDRKRGVAVMLYGGATWEFDGASWSNKPFPSTWTSCTAAITSAFDGARGKTVAYGCSVPATTWEWDGDSWAGPFASPYQSLVWRDRGDLVKTQWDASDNWKGTLQSAWTHPNAAFESTALGGVSMIDGDGTIRTWNGTTWTAGATIAEGNTCWVSQTPGSTWDYSRGLRYVYPWPVSGSYWSGTLIGVDFLPHCFFPPAIEDAAHKRILAFRDGPRGLLELPTDAPTAWRAAPLGRNDFASPWGGPLLTTVHPYPFEMMSPEHGYFKTMSDPPSRVHQDGTTTGSFGERRVPNLWWPFRVLSDPTTKRVRFLSNRGLLWELGGESVAGLGGTCESDVDCIAGTCTSEKVCCDTYNCGDSICTTCKGSTPGRCEVVAAGGAEPKGRCGTGECAGTCGGTAGVCSFDASRACGPGPTCENAVLTPGGHCAPDSAGCVLSGVAPSCPLRPDGTPDLTAKVFVGSTAVPCALPPTACSGGVMCASASECKPRCESRLDCTSRFNTCNGATGFCEPDSASQLATTMGVTPCSYKPPPLLSTSEVVDQMLDAGIERDEAGIFHVPSPAFAGVKLGFDPAVKTPMLGLRRCVDAVVVTMSASATKSIDSAVAAATRCVGTSPWFGDPAGDDCCPEACLKTYFEARKTMSERAALELFLTSGCYPGTSLPSDAGAAVDGGVE